jgi:hypothetical protein
MSCSVREQVKMLTVGLFEDDSQSCSDDPHDKVIGFRIQQPEGRCHIVQRVRWFCLILGWSTALIKDRDVDCFIL